MNKADQIGPGPPISPDPNEATSGIGIPAHLEELTDDDLLINPPGNRESVEAQLEPFIADRGVSSEEKISEEKVSEEETKKTEPNRAEKLKKARRLGVFKKVGSFFKKHPGITVGLGMMTAGVLLALLASGVGAPALILPAVIFIGIGFGIGFISAFAEAEVQSSEKEFYEAHKPIEEANKKFTGHTADKLGQKSKEYEIKELEKKLEEQTNPFRKHRLQMELDLKKETNPFRKHKLKKELEKLDKKTENTDLDQK